MANAIICKGDSTSHGGTVLEGFATLNVLGKNAAGVVFLGEKSGLSEVYEGKGI